MTEPPSRIPPRNNPQSSKAERDELSSKGKVEKVREVDADESRKRKFQKAFEEAPKKESLEGEKPPSLFDLPSQDPKLRGSGADRGIVPDPSYSRPIAKDSPPAPQPRDQGPDPLPKSDRFWEEVDSDRDSSDRQFKETPLQDKDKEHKTGQAHKQGKGAPIHAKKGKKEAAEEVTLPGVPMPQHGKVVAGHGAKGKEKAEKGAVSMPIDGGVKTTPPRFVEPGKKQIEEESETAFIPVKEKEEKPKDKQGKTLDITPVSTNFPSTIQPLAAAATQAATPYLHPSTTALFFQMVGTIYVMANTGVNRTEIVLNNPSFANSKFFGATITIEKYATAPDSFNIRLTGTEAAVASFKDNAASLMSAFQNGNFSFKVNRLDAEYTLEKPVFRRKEKGDRGDGNDRGGR